MPKDVDYNSLRERLYSKKDENIQQEKETKKEPSQYRLIKERLKSESSDMKADSIVFALGLPKDLYDNRISLPSEEGKEKWGYAPIKDRDEKKRIKKIVERYTKKDVEEAIINELHDLNYGMGVRAIHRTGPTNKIYWGPEGDKRIRKQNYPDNYLRSLDDMKKLETILSNKSFLRKHGITNEEIKKYQETFKKRVGGILETAVKNADDKRNIELTERMLDYAKKEGLINYKRTGLEKSIAVLSIGSVLAGIFFLSPNLTGNVIGNMTRSSGNLIGGILFGLGIVGAFFTLRK
ncbi:MAG: hypothetical protein ABIE36_01560 [Candidatus Diapherotrites archaeon]